IESVRRDGFARLQATGRGRPEATNLEVVEDADGRLGRLEERVGANGREIALANNFTANGDDVVDGEFNATTELVHAFRSATGVREAHAADRIDQRIVGDDRTGAQIGEELARSGNRSSRIPHVVAGNFDAEQNRINGDEVHADGGTDDTIGGAGRN